MHRALVNSQAISKITATSNRTAFRTYSSEAPKEAPKHTSPETPPKQSTHRPGGLSEPLPIIPFALILAATSGLYMLIVKRKAQAAEANVSQPTTARYRRNA